MQQPSNTSSEKLASPESRALSTQEGRPATVKAWLAMPSTTEQLAKALPRHFSAERFSRIALTSFLANPDLQKCTMESVVTALLRCAQYGIEPDGRRAHLIPFKDVCTLIFDYKGLAELVRRSGDVISIHADVVYANDEFDYCFGTGAFLRHKPTLKERGDMLCAYSFVKLKDGSDDFDVMSIPDVEKVRKTSRAASSGPWTQHFPEMAKKTIFRRHSKWLPLSPELSEAIQADDEPLSDETRFEAAKPVSPILPRAQRGNLPTESGSSQVSQPLDRGNAAGSESTVPNKDTASETSGGSKSKRDGVADSPDEQPGTKTDKPSGAAAPASEASSSNSTTPAAASGARQESPTPAESGKAEPVTGQPSSEPQDDDPAPLRDKVLEHAKTYGWTKDDFVAWAREKKLISRRSPLVFDAFPESLFEQALRSIESLDNATR